MDVFTVSFFGHRRLSDSLTTESKLQKVIQELLRTKEYVEFLVGREIFIEEQAQDDDDEFYMEDLIGFKVSVGKLRGELTDYYDSEANPLFEIVIDGKEHLIPAQEEFIAHIDFDKRNIKFILPDGLLDL